MAESLVSIVLEKLGSIVLDGIKEDVRLIVGEEIKRLTDTLIGIQWVLQDADDKQMKNKEVKSWLEEFKDISYDAEDVLDKWSTRSLIRNVQHPDLNALVIKKQVRFYSFSLFSCFKPIVIGHDIGNQIRDLNGRLFGVVEKEQSYDLRAIRSNEEHRPISSDFVVDEEIYGRDDDKELLLTKLRDVSAHLDSHVPVISIVGPGGLGKTTLAKLILEQTDKLREFEFDIYFMVCVSDPFNLEKVAKEIIEKAVKATRRSLDSTLGWEELLRQSLRKMRFLLVLDDVWFHNDNEWRQLKQALDKARSGSVILITTRDEKGASMTDSSYTHMLRPLSNDACWSVFKRVADLDKFEDIGKAISIKCSGIPLGTKVLASLMRLKTTEQEWCDVLASHVWDFKEDMEGILPSILLSYYALPSYLKPCVMYFAVFPKDAIFEKKTIIQLWMAQGYLGSDEDRSADLEMKGRDYFDNLSKLSFLQILERDNEGNITSCKMHDLVHDCVRFISKTDTIVFENEPLFNSVKIRHLSAQDLNWTSIYKNKKLRSVIRSISTSTNWNRNGTRTLNLLFQLQCLRVLSLQGYQFKELPSEVEKLLQLRYLDLSDNSSLEILPETICNLVNLQTLKMKRCKSLTRLPEGIKMLSKLRHLEIEGCKLRPYSSGGCEFRILDTSIVVVIDAQNNEGFTVGDLKLLNHLDLQGHLKINELGQVNDSEYAAQFELKKKEIIVSLVLDFGWKQEKILSSVLDIVRKQEVMRMEGILEALRPHGNLKKLVIKYYQGIQLPTWISSLFNLTVLTLMDCHFLQSTASYSGILGNLGGLESLEFLHLHGLISVKTLGYEFYRHPIFRRTYSDSEYTDPTIYMHLIFPKLKKLILSSMPNLEQLDLAYEIAEEDYGGEFCPNLSELILRDFFPNLRTIRIGWLPGLLKLPGFGKLNCLETLELSRMDGLKHSFHEFMGIPNTGKRRGRVNGRVEFPALTNLCLFGLTEWEEKEGDTYHIGDVDIMPRLRKLSIHRCPKLMVIPFYMFSDELRELTVQICPQLGLYQRVYPSLPPLLEKLKFEGEVGYLSVALNADSDSYTNLHYFEIFDSSQSSLQVDFDRLTSIRQLVFHNCEGLDFMADKLKHLTMLEQLKISHCPGLAERFSKGDISSSSSHYYKIFIRQLQRESTEIEESSHSDLEKSYQSDVILHRGIFCDNCEMYPIVGKRYKCQDCYEEEEHTGGFDLCENCYNTPSKHPDHHTQGHTFEHMLNCGDSSGPVHSDDEDVKGGLRVVKLVEIEEQNNA